MSYTIIYDFKLVVETSLCDEDHAFFVALAGDNNVYEFGNRRRARDWVCLEDAPGVYTLIDKLSEWKKEFEEQSCRYKGRMNSYRTFMNALYNKSIDENNGEFYHKIVVPNSLSRVTSSKVPGNRLVPKDIRNAVRKNFEDFLKEFEGDVSAQTVADAWNKLSKKHKWGDTLKAVEPKEWHD